MIFTYPFLLLAILILPFLYRWMRVMPLGQMVVSFSAMMFLTDKDGVATTKNSIPIWLLLLRLLILLLLIIFAAAPRQKTYYDNLAIDHNLPTLMIIDTSWSADLPTVINDITSFLSANNQISVMLTSQNNIIQMNQNLWPSYNRQIKISPYQQDISNIATLKNWHGQIIYYAPARFGQMQKEIIATLEKNFPKVATVITPSNNKNHACAVIRDFSGVKLTLSNNCTSPVHLQIQNFITGEIIAKTSTSGLEATFPTLNTAKNMAKVISITGQDHLGGRWLLSSGATGNAAVIHSNSNPNSLLEEATYVTKALKQSSISVITGSLSSLLSKDIATYFIPDAVILDENNITLLRQKAEKGATIVRFWGDRLNAVTPDARDSLLPVALRIEARKLGTALSWQNALGSLPLSLPLRGDVTDILIKKQILPDSEYTAMATAKDQTPWITTQKIGRGQIILIHTGIMPQWSNIATSKAFVPLMASLHALGNNSDTINNTNTTTTAQAFELQANGDLISGGSGILGIDKDKIPPTAQHPAGFYGSGDKLLAHNISGFIADDVPADTALAETKLPITTITSNKDNGDLRPILLKTIMLLFLMDGIAAWIILKKHHKIIITALLLFSISTPSVADDNINAVQVAFVLTGQNNTDNASKVALKKLIDETTIRTNMPIMSEPLAISLNTSVTDLAKISMIYWPLAGNINISEKIATALKQYVTFDGLLIIDTKSGNNPLQHKQMVGQLQPLVLSFGFTPLQTLPKQHVLYHSYYIIPNLSGMWGGINSYAAYPQGVEEKVFGVITIGNDWAGGMLSNDHITTEQSIRTGINMLMYSTTTT